MQTVRLRLVTIVGEAILEERITNDLKRLGAVGFTVSAAHGQGSRGLRTMDWEVQNVRIETIVAPDVADAILTHMAAEYFDHFAVIVWVSDAEVVRGDKYIRE